MKVIENNNKVTVSCTNCGSKLEIEPGDIEVSAFTNTLYVVCEACGSPVVVEGVDGIDRLFRQQVLNY